MKNATACAKKLKTLLKQMPTGKAPAEIEEMENPIEILILSFLMEDATAKKALRGLASIRSSLVDYNELRVCMDHEIVAMIGPRYPGAQERCERLRAAIRDVYLRQHAVSMDPLFDMGKRDARKYLDTLDGITPYVAARTALMAFDVHAVPVDESTRAALVKAGAADESAMCAELGSWLERQIKADDSLDAHYAMQAWVEKGGSSTSKKTTKKRPSTKKKASSRSTTTTRKKKTTTRRKTSTTKK